MNVILGIDIGGSSTKIVGLRTDGSVISMLRVRAEDQVWGDLVHDRGRGAPSGKGGGLPPFAISRSASR